MSGKKSRLKLVPEFDQYGDRIPKTEEAAELRQRLLIASSAGTDARSLLGVLHKAMMERSDESLDLAQALVPRLLTLSYVTMTAVDEDVEKLQGWLDGEVCAL